MKQISNRTFDQERALYGSRELLVKDCAFDGPADGRARLRSLPKSGRSIAFSTCVTRSGTSAGCK